MKQTLIIAFQCPSTHKYTQYIIVGIIVRFFKMYGYQAHVHYKDTVANTERHVKLQISKKTL